MEAWLGFEPSALLLAVGLGAARTIPLVWLIPAFGGPSLPGAIRIGLGLGMALLCLPVLTGPASWVAGQGAFLWVSVLAREAAVGATVGFVGSCLFQAATGAGRLVDLFRGATLAEVLSPLSGDRTSPVGELFLLLAITLFLELGGIGFVASALARSYQAIPLQPVGGPDRLAALLPLVMRASGQILESALVMAAPVLVATLLADLILGIIARAAPQIPIYFVGMPLKALAGVGALLAGMGAIRGTLEAGFGGWGRLIERGFQLGR